MFPLWSPGSRPTQWISLGVVLPPRAQPTMSHLGSGVTGAQRVEARCRSAADSPGQACPWSSPGTMPAVPQPKNSSRTQILQL